MERLRTATLTPKQEAVAALLAAGRELRSAALEIGVGERTVHTWKGLPAFRARVAGLRDEMLSTAVGKLSAAASVAVDALVGLLESPG